MRTLYTIGYQKRTLEDFVEILAREGIGVLVDVRDVAWSHKPGFTKGTLAEALKTAGIDYVHAQFAGNPKRLREDSAGLKPLLDAYARHLDDDPTIEERFRTLIHTLQDEGKRVCILCFERDPAECHRKVLAERWSRRSAGKIEHLGAEQAERPASAGRR